MNVFIAKLNGYDVTITVNNENNMPHIKADKINNTKNIFLESAYFKPKSIRSTSKILNVNTDAKYRFERGIDTISI